MKILALDLGKFNSVACQYDKVSAEHEFQKIRTTPRELRALFVATRPDLVVFEVCSFAGWIHDLVADLGIPGQVANLGDALEDRFAPGVVPLHEPRHLDQHAAQQRRAMAADPPGTPHRP